MKSIITIILFSTLTAILPGEAIDMCEVVNPDTGVPILCGIHAEGAPVYDGDVCCAEEICAPAKSPCIDGTLYHCDLGEEDASGFTCYFEVPNYCDVFLCEEHTPGYQSPAMSFSDVLRQRRVLDVLGGIQRLRAPGSLLVQRRRLQ